MTLIQHISRSHDRRAQIASTPELLVYDTFTDANGTSLDAHTPDIDRVGGGWALALSQGEGPAAAQIQGNMLQTDANYGGAVIDAGVSDVEVHVEWTPMAAAANRHNLAVRYNSDGNVWRLVFREDNNDLLLQEMNAGGGTTRASLAVTISEGVTYNPYVEAVGSIIVFWIDDASAEKWVNCSYSSATQWQTETEHGLMELVADSNPIFDNLRIYDRS